MIKIFQKQWFDIKFNQIAQLNRFTMPTSDFYKKFYDVFYQRYHHHDDLPLDYKQSKRQLALHLAARIRHKKVSSVLSIGCGNGIVEKYLTEELPDIRLLAYETDINNMRWLKNKTSITLCDENIESVLAKHPGIDYIYLATVDYALSDEEYIAMLSLIRKLSAAPVLLTGIIKPLPNAFAWCKYQLKFVLARLGLYRLGQFWGYLRNTHEHKAIFKQAGYEITSSGDLSHDLMWIELAPTSLSSLR